MLRRVATHSPVATPTGTLRDQVAGDVRALLAYRRISGNALAARLGLSQKWVSRRLSGEVAFDVDDLQLIASELGVDVRILLGIPTSPTVAKVPQSATAARLRAIPTPQTVSLKPHSPRPLLQVVTAAE